MLTIATDQKMLVPSITKRRREGKKGDDIGSYTRAVIGLVWKERR